MGSFKFLLIPVIAFILALIAAIILFFVAKKDRVINQTRLIVVILLGAVILAVPATLILTGLPYLSTIFIFCAVYSLFMGYIYVTYYPKILENPDLNRRWIQILALLVSTAMGGIIFVVIFHYLSDIDYGFRAAAPLLFVFIPVFFSYTLDSLLDIPVEIYQVWHYKENHPINWFDGYFDGMFVFQIELYKNRNDLNITKIKAKAFETVVFKEWFQRFLDDFNKKYTQAPIECNGDNSGQSFGWIFYVRPTFWPVRHYIDFDKTMAENNIGDSTIIVAKRVIQARPDQNSERQEEFHIDQEYENTIDEPTASNPSPSVEESGQGQGSTEVVNKVKQDAERVPQEIMNKGVTDLQQAGQRQLMDQIPKP